MTRKKTQATNATDISVKGDVSGSKIIVGDGNQINYYGEQRPAVILRAVPPAPPPYFTGREGERKRLAKSLLSGQAVAITAVHGMGGIGKTALAQKVAQDLLEEKAFPGGVLWWSLGPNADAFAALSAWAAYFDPQANLTQLPPEARPGFVRAGLTKLGRLCAILDDAWDEESTQTLMAALPPGTAVLLTTRDADLAKALRCRVDHGLPGLPEDKCLELLASLLGPLEGCEDAAKEIARLTEGLPLALELIAGLADSPADLPALAEQLTKAPQLDLLKLPGEEKREKSLEACFALSYNALSEELQARFRALGVFPAPFDEAALFAVWGAEDTGYLKRLLRRSLLKKEESSLLRQHNLLRAYSVALLQGEAQEEKMAVQRHGNYYLEQSIQANNLYIQGHEYALEALQRFDALWPHLQIAYEHNAQIAGDPRADRWLSDLSGRVAYLLGLRLTAYQHIPLLENALAAAHRLEDRYYEGIHLGNLGNTYFNLGDPRRAIQYYEQNLVIVHEIGDQRGEAQDLGNLGNAYIELGDLGRAIEYYKENLSLAREIRNQHGEGAALSGLGNAYFLLGEVHDAINYYKQALDIFHEIGSWRGRGDTFANLGNAYKKLGELHQAIEHYAQAVKIFREIGDQQGEGNALNNLGTIYFNLGELRHASEYYEQQLLIARKIGDKRGEVNSLWNLGLVLEKQGEFRRAAELMQVRIDFYRSIGHSDAEKLAKYLEEVRKKAEEQPPPASRKDTGTV